MRFTKNVADLRFTIHLLKEQSGHSLWRTLASKSFEIQTLDRYRMKGFSSEMSHVKKSLNRQKIAALSRSLNHLTEGTVFFG